MSNINILQLRKKKKKKKNIYQEKQEEGGRRKEELGVFFAEIRVRKTKKSNQKKIKERDIVVDKSTPMSTTTTQQHTREVMKK